MTRPTRLVRVFDYYLPVLEHASKEARLRQFHELALARQRPLLYRKFRSLGLAKYFAPKPLNGERLARIVVKARLDGFQPDKHSEGTFHKAAKPLDELIALLDDQENWDVAVYALSEGPIWWTDVKAAERVECLRGDLRKLRAAVPQPPPKRDRGKPSKTKKLRLLVTNLAVFWDEEGGPPFTQDRHKGKPLTKAARFVDAIVGLVDPSMLQSVPKVMESVIGERRTTSRK
jgi:hypothetical protein